MIFAQVIILYSCTTRRVYTKGYPATRPGRERAAQPLNLPALRITAGKATATDCLNCQSLLKWQFAMYPSTAEPALSLHLC